MEDKLKKMVQLHQQEIDTLQAPEFLWERIAADLDKQQNKAATPIRRLWTKPMLRAAAVALLMIVATLLIRQQWENTASQQAFWSRYPELQEAEARFRPMIIAKVRRLEQIGDKALTDALLQDLALLEQDYETLAKDLRDNADNRQIVKAMVENYRSRLQLLERILQEIEKKQNHEKADVQL
ncbi:MAG: hypothetical protein RMJ87_03895 [Cytophagales bacterium]|nr:hypothetical protein [Bernardetiaceae bacterium]MDW8204150.1 hypothetical protein [Cytophagales bacterium]